MWPRDINGINFIEGLRCSFYGTSVNAFADIIDNSIDANANKIEIITNIRNNIINEIYFIDNGLGMNSDILKNCIKLPGSKLLKSSLSQCKDLSIFSKSINGIWLENHLDFEQVVINNAQEIGNIQNADINVIYSIISKSRISEISTIIRWRKIDRLDVKMPKTIFNSAKKLIGRIHRYNIREGLDIRFLNYNDDSNEADIDELLIENDPLYLTERPSQIASVINELALTVTSSNPTLSLDTYFRKYTIKGVKNTVLPLFYKPEVAQQKIQIDWLGHTYVIHLVCSIAYTDLQNLCTTNGGATKFAKELGKKVIGSHHYPSGNISWVRNNREIASGNYNLFNIANENMRFWSIELKWDTGENNGPGLDFLLSLGQSSRHFSFLPENELPDVISESACGEDKRKELFFKITKSLEKSIEIACGLLNAQAKKWDL